MRNNPRQTGFSWASEDGPASPAAPAIGAGDIRARADSEGGAAAATPAADPDAAAAALGAAGAIRVRAANRVAGVRAF
jgi:hypothetical protein